MEIKVGEYGRTNKGDIFIYANVVAVDKNGNKLDYIIKFVNGEPIKYYLNKDEKIVKHSKNIIDLIEGGDFVNGYKIIAINYKENYITIQNINEFGENGIKVLQEDEIKTILTKEQMEANCYTVERKEEC